MKQFPRVPLPGLLFQRLAAPPAMHDLPSPHWVLIASANGCPEHQHHGSSGGGAVLPSPSLFCHVYEPGCVNFEGFLKHSAKDWLSGFNNRSVPSCSLGGWKAKV